MWCVSRGGSQWAPQSSPFASTVLTSPLLWQLIFWGGGIGWICTAMAAPIAVNKMCHCSTSPKHMLLLAFHPQNHFQRATASARHAQASPTRSVKELPTRDKIANSCRNPSSVVNKMHHYSTSPKHRLLLVFHPQKQQAQLGWTKQLTFAGVHCDLQKSCFEGPFTATSTMN